LLVLLFTDWAVGDAGASSCTTTQLAAHLPEGTSRRVGLAIILFLLLVKSAHALGIVTELFPLRFIFFDIGFAKFVHCLFAPEIGNYLDFVYCGYNLNKGY
jgi:hypothetical protein